MKSACRRPLPTVVLSMLLLSACGSSPESPGGTGNVGYAGVRSSSYGVDPFPDPAGWASCISIMADAFPGSSPCALWIVGTVDESIQGVNLEFPSPGGSYPNISFSDSDMHEEYFAWFDDCGIEVFLQVEPGFADVPTVIGLVLDNYADHPCVTGFGVDVEWFGNVTEGGEGMPVDDSTAGSWEALVTYYDPGYGLFLKHWDPAFMPPSYRGDLIFVDDGQGYSNMEEYLADMAAWAEEFDPNRVFFQYGYDSDSTWWGSLGFAPVDIGEALAAQTPQECGLFWVDFNLDELQR